MKPTPRRARRRPASQPEQQPEQRFFGPAAAAPFFAPTASIHRSLEGPSGMEEKKEEKVNRAPEDKKEEEKISKAPEDKQEEHEEKISRKGEAGGVGEATTAYVKGIHGKGQPLPAREQRFFGERMGYDFSGVRIHTGEDAAASAKDAQAKAYTYGNHLVFNQGRYDTGSHEGRKLLAHELTHVVQQNAGLKSQVRRQTGDRTAPAAPGPTTVATDPAVFQSRLSLALSQMTTPTVAGETLSGTLEPVLRDMATHAEWRDASGNASGGAEVPVRLSRGGRTVRLRLVLDDNTSPPMSGQFNSTGADVGTLKVFVRLNSSPDTLATTLYHESLHLMRWLARNAPGGDLVAETGATGGRRATLQGIDPARQPRHMAMVRRRVADLASSVNAARPASDRVNESGIDRVTEFVMEEYLTRIETEVFRLMRDSDAAARPGASVRFGTSPDTFFPRADVDNYLFEYNSVFRVGDRASLGEYDRVLITGLYEYFRDRVMMFVRLRYSEVVHGPEYP